MNKKIIFFVFVVLIITGLYFYLKKSPEIKLTKKKIQNKFCFCSQEENKALTACFNPSGKEFAVWNSKFNLALASFKIPFRNGTWKKTKENIKITFSNGEEFEIRHNSVQEGAFPALINLKDVQLKPDYCKNIDWSELSKNLETSNNLGFYCSDDKKDLKINILINFKDATFSEWTGDTLLVKESVFIETPTEIGIFQKDGNEFTFHTSSGMEKRGRVTLWEIGNKIPKKIEFGSGTEITEIEKDQCLWMKKSLRQIPLVAAKNILCEKKQNDLVLNILPDQKINIYLNTKSFSFKDFVSDKFTIQGTDLTLKNDEISFKNKDNLVKGFFEKKGDKISLIKIPKGPKVDELEYSYEYCPPFYLTDKLWK